MKKNGMNTLIDLLNEYDDNNWGVTDYGALFNRMNEGISETEYLQVISKKFGFIKWLVDNDKIDRHNVGYSTMLGQLSDYHGLNGEQELLMILSIQDNPIEFLVSILKIS